MGPTRLPDEGCLDSPYHSGLPGRGDPAAEGGPPGRGDLRVGGILFMRVTRIAREICLVIEAGKLSWEGKHPNLPGEGGQGGCPGLGHCSSLGLGGFLGHLSDSQCAALDV